MYVYRVYSKCLSLLYLEFSRFFLFKYTYLITINGKNFPRTLATLLYSYIIIILYYEIATHSSFCYQGCKNEHSACLHFVHKPIVSQGQFMKTIWTSKNPY